MNKKKLLLGALVASLFITNQVFAHATVKPATTGVGKFQNFVLGAPSEKPIATVGIRLVLPDGLNHVTPNVKAGWKITTKKETINNEQKITEIIWTGGTIPTEMRDEFLFSAQVPSKATALNWKVYQTYADGSVVAWDKDPSLSHSDTMEEEQENTGPYSKTEVIDDLIATTTNNSLIETSENKEARIAVWLSAAAVLIALVTFKKAAKK
ncbi:MAG: DUF1775 domain-containing protein [Candidatus Magasanikbacteria bacterium]|nr:DUF1775 domain-containing protein [Candidatus Magasanikbacteria bacterium]